MQALQDMRTCYSAGVCDQMLPSSCYPCYCLGLYQSSLNRTTLDRVMATTIKSQCSDFVLKFDPRTVAIRYGVALSAKQWQI